MLVGHRALMMRPSWALTAEQAAEKQVQEEENLLRFAEGLDFDEFVQGMDGAELEAAIQVRLNRSSISKTKRGLASFWL
jgi:hypothetical protein